MDPHLELVAQAHSRDMALRSFFDHPNPYGMQAVDRVNAVTPPFWTAVAENIAAGLSASPLDTPADTMARWIASPGHDANISDPNLTHIGIGAYYRTGDTQGLYAYFTQVFARWSEDPSAHDWLEPAEVPAP